MGGLIKKKTLAKKVAALLVVAMVASPLVDGEVSASEADSISVTVSDNNSVSNNNLARTVSENVNLVNNASFEEGLTGGWEPDGAVINAEVKQTGNHSARLGVGESGCYYPIKEDFSEVETFTLSAYGCVSVEGDTGLVNIEMYGEDGLISRQGMEFSNVGNEMHNQTKTIEKAEGTTWIKVVLYKATTAGGFAYFDDISVIADKIEEPKLDAIPENVNLIQNFGFEESLTGWAPDGLRLDTETAKNGTNSGVIGPGEGGGYIDITADFSEAEKMEISGWGKVQTLCDMAETGCFGVNMRDADGVIIQRQEVTFTSEENFELKNLTFPIAEGTCSITIYLYNNNNADEPSEGYTWFDDLSVVVDPMAGVDSIREKVIINQPPTGYEWELTDIPDEYVTTIDDKDYYYRTYKCFTNTLAEAEAAKKSDESLAYCQAELVETLVEVNEHEHWYKREYKYLMRAMWVWHEENVVDVATRDAMFEFSKEKGINTIYIQLHTLAENAEAYRAFNKKAHGLGITVEALDGRDVWVLAKNHAEPLASIQSVIDFNNAVTDPAEKFDGIHHDNEPYTVDGWNENKVQIAADYLALAEKSIAMAHENGMTYAVDIPMWYENDAQTKAITYNGETKPLSEHIIDLVDYIGIMSYRDVAEGKDGIIYFASDEAAYAASIGKEVVTGVETLGFAPDDVDNPEKITFHEEGEAHMIAEMAKVTAYFVDAYRQMDYMAAPGFKGMAIHYYETYRDLPYGPRE